MLQPLALILKALGRPVSRSRHRTAARTPGDHLCGEMIDRHRGMSLSTMGSGHGPDLVGFGVGEAPPRLAHQRQWEAVGWGAAPLRPHTLLAMYK